MRNQSHSYNTDAIRYRYNIVAEDGKTVIRAVPVATCRAEVEREPAAVERNDVEIERAGHLSEAGSSPVFRRLRHRLLDR